MHIYKITNTINSRVYIGLTTGSIQKRWREHRCAANLNYDKPLYRAMRKYGENKFSIQIIYTASTINELRDAELRLITEYKAHVNDGGYNLTDHGFVHGRANQLSGEEMYNSKLTEEMVAFIRDPIHWNKSNAAVLIMLQEHFGFNGARDTIRDARRGEAWKYLNDKYPPVKSMRGQRQTPMSEERRQIAAQILNKYRTQALDKLSKIRNGKRGANAKLSEQTVKEIFYSQMSLLKTAAQYGVSKKMVLLIKQRKAHVYLTKGL